MDTFFTSLRKSLLPQDEEIHHEDRRRATAAIWKKEPNRMFDAIYLNAEKIKFLDHFERKKTAALLFFGAIFGLMGFMFAFIIGLLTFTNPLISDWAQHFPSGFGYFPATVSEMVHDPSEPAGKCFFAFEFIGAFFIFQSWYPFHLRNVYIGDDATLPWPFNSISWMMFRQFIPPAGMMLVATVTTTPFAQATLLDYFCIGIHLTGAVMLFAGYGLIEAKTIGLWPFKAPEVADKALEDSYAERLLRKVCMVSLTFFYAVFCVLQGVLLYPGWTGNDVWQKVTVTDKYGKKVQEMALQNTASGIVLTLKIASYASEVACGVSLIASFIIIWVFCKERRADLNDTIFVDDLDEVDPA